MARNITCTTCEITLLAFESVGSKPIGADECPRCGGTEFEFLDT